MNSNANSATIQAISSPTTFPTLEETMRSHIHRALV